MNVVGVDCPPAIRERFRRQAVDAFPCETYAFLLGTFAGGTYTIHETYTPVSMTATESAIYFGEDEADNANARAAAMGVAVIGDIHSHPRLFSEWCGSIAEATPSEWDHDEGIGGLCGICVVSQAEDFKLNTRIRFYGPAAKVREITT